MPVIHAGFEEFWKEHEDPYSEGSCYELEGRIIWEAAYNAALKHAAEICRKQEDHGLNQWVEGFQNGVDVCASAIEAEIAGKLPS